MALEQIANPLEDGEKVEKLLAQMKPEKRIDYLKRAIQQTDSEKVRKYYNTLLGRAYSEKASSLRYEEKNDRERAENIINAIRAYENAGFGSGTVEEKKRLHGLYNYAANLCPAVGIIEGWAEFSGKAHSLRKSFI